MIEQKKIYTVTSNYFVAQGFVFSKGERIQVLGSVNFPSSDILIYRYRTKQKLKANRVELEKSVEEI